MSTPGYRLLLSGGWRASKGFVAEHEFDLHMETASDSEIWARAESTCAVIVTKDEYFVALATSSSSGPRVLLGTSQTIPHAASESTGFARTGSGPLFERIRRRCARMLDDHPHPVTDFAGGVCLVPPQSDPSRSRSSSPLVH